MKKQIRIIKHAGRDVQRDTKDVADMQVGASPPERVSSRKTVRIVTARISEFRQKKITDMAVDPAFKASLTKFA